MTTETTLACPECGHKADRHWPLVGRWDAGCSGWAGKDDHGILIACPCRLTPDNIRTRAELEAVALGGSAEERLRFLAAKGGPWMAAKARVCLRAMGLGVDDDD